LVQTFSVRRSNGTFSPFFVFVSNPDTLALRIIKSIFLRPEKLSIGFLLNHIYHLGFIPEQFFRNLSSMQSVSGLFSGFLEFAESWDRFTIFQLFWRLTRFFGLSIWLKDDFGIVSWEVYNFIIKTVLLEQLLVVHVKGEVLILD
jgi:hypothetical protein